MTKIIRPNKYPRWASSLVRDEVTHRLNIYEPSEAKKDIGWVAGEVPPRQWVNWSNNLTYQWIKYLDHNVSTPTEYAKDSLPSAASHKAKIVYISDLDDGTLAFSNGANWKKIKTEGNI